MGLAVLTALLGVVLFGVPLGAGVLKYAGTSSGQRYWWRRTSPRPLSRRTCSAPACPPVFAIRRMGRTWQCVPTVVCAPKASGRRAGMRRWTVRCTVRSAPGIPRGDLFVAVNVEIADPPTRRGSCPAGSFGEEDLSFDA